MENPEQTTSVAELEIIQVDNETQPTEVNCEINFEVTSFDTEIPQYTSHPDHPTHQEPHQKSEQETTVQEPATVTHDTETVLYQPETVSQPETVNQTPETVLYEPVSYQPEPVSYQPETVSHQPEPVSYQPEPVSYQLEPVSYQPETVNHEPEVHVTGSSTNGVPYERLPDEFFKTIFYFSGMGTVIGSAMSEGVHVEERHRGRAVEVDQLPTRVREQLHREEFPLVVSCRDQAHKLYDGLRNLHNLLDGVPTYTESKTPTTYRPSSTTPVLDVNVDDPIHGHRYFRDNRNK